MDKNSYKYEKYKEYQKKLYHTNKNNPNSSCYLPHRLKLQRDAYKEKNLLLGKSVKIYNTTKKKNSKINVNYGVFIISF
jgi:hypothetical protein